MASPRGIAEQYADRVKLALSRQRYMSEQQERALLLEGLDIGLSLDQARELLAATVKQQGAARESQEEALAHVEIGSLLAVVHVLHARQVHVFFRASMRGGDYGAGAESLEVALVPTADIPWGDLAFPSTEFALRHWLEDRAAGREPHHFTTIDRRLGAAGGSTS